MTLRASVVHWATTTPILARHPGREIDWKTMTKLPILDFKGLSVAINPAHVLKIEERESKDGTPRCIIHFIDQSNLTWDGKLSALLPLLL